MGIMSDLSPSIDFRGRLLLGIVTMKPSPWEIEDNYNRLEAHIREAHRRRAGVVVASECVLDGYVATTAEATKNKMLKIAQNYPDGPYLMRAGSLCRELSIFLVFGFLERRQDKLYNSCCLIGPEGKFLAKYSKVNPGGEQNVTAGCELKPFDTPIGRVGFVICSDRHFGHNFDTLGVQGVDIIFVPMNGGSPGTENLRIRAKDNKCWIAVSNAWCCALINPAGGVLLDKYECECVSVAQISYSQIPRGDKRNLFMGRRFDLYKPLAQCIEKQRYFDEYGNATPLEDLRRKQTKKAAAEIRKDINWEK